MLDHKWLRTPIDSDNLPPRVLWSYVLWFMYCDAPVMCCDTTLRYSTVCLVRCSMNPHSHCKIAGMKLISVLLLSFYMLCHPMLGAFYARNYVVSILAWTSTIVFIVLCYWCLSHCKLILHAWCYSCIILLAGLFTRLFDSVAVNLRFVVACFVSLLQRLVASAI